MTHGQGVSGSPATEVSPSATPGVNRGRDDTPQILRRAFEVHGDPRFERLAGISRSHVYNLRGSRTYRAAAAAGRRPGG